jgi:hypothetical protein
MQEIKTPIEKGIQINNRELVNTVHYAEDQRLMATSEDDLQTVAHRLNLIARKYKMTISSAKTINGNVGEPHTEGKNCDKRQYY